MCEGSPEHKREDISVSADLFSLSFTLYAFKVGKHV